MGIHPLEIDPFNLLRNRQHTSALLWPEKINQSITLKRHQSCRTKVVNNA